MGFRDTLDAHLRAIEERDLDALLATVAEDAVVILPRGQLLRGRDAVAELHRDWFGATTWSVRAEPVRVLEEDGTGHALLRVDYRDVDEAGQPLQRRYYLSLLFLRRNGSWLLVHDQNTYC